ncbi:olfactory receptor 6N1 [Scleropages formosus]|uniref:olfactory receptor 6N1 n=1 Tax=Scleropages formosus TaxID=113540 RepID=UPI000878B4D5|nr:olfactory receptor 6N1-like [Scleropages formosus]
MNSSRVVTEFIIVGMSGWKDKQTVFFLIFLLAYAAILGGNSMIIYLVRTDSRLSSPMYFFLHNLSFVDIIYTSITMPNMLSGFLTEIKTISVSGCFAQMYVFLSMAVVGRALLTVMAFDRYVAVCIPLRYTAIMTPRLQHQLIAGAWLFGATIAVPSFVMAVRLPFCGPNRVEHCFCDHSSVVRLACADTSMNSAVALAGALVALLTTLALILSSYVAIGISIARAGSAEGRWKAFGTCVAHLTVVSISYTSASFVYISYRVGNFSSDVRIIVAILYSALTPLLNPLIFSLRNKELRDAAKRAFCKHAVILPQKKAMVFNLSKALKQPE